MSVTPGPSALVPLTRTFIQDSTTTAIALVGQVLDNGETNFVGYDDGGALYLLTSSADGAVETTLGDGQQYFYTSGPAPSGFTATDGGSGGATMSDDDDESSATTSGASITTISGTNGAATTSTRSSQTTGGNGGSRTSAGAASATTESNAGQLSVKGVVGITFGFLSIFGLYAL